MRRPGERWLIAAALLSAAAAVMHLAVIACGPDWYRFFGAGEGMARLAERGSAKPALITLAIAAVLAAWSAYALSGAGTIRRLPLLRTALVLITAVYLLRGLVLLPALAVNGGRVDSFTLWSSLIVLVYGIVYAVGTFRAWPALAGTAR
ncbi:MAG TPA: hypothetical protein VK403_02845 [Allosphingosinicella sp.]|nr:hypothetical protein [Allosphingosinicella sp.]